MIMAPLYSPYPFPLIPFLLSLTPYPLPLIPFPMQVDVITLFPEVVTVPLSASIMGRAREKGVLDLRVHDLREHGIGKYRQVDDEPYGGGPGMVMRPEPIFAQLEQIKTPQSRVLFMSPQGKRFDQNDARRLSTELHLIILCGHYEGVDQRVIDTCVDEELSLGDYVLTNGAIAAAVMIDAIVRLIPGVLGDDESAIQESFGESGLLDHPHYTRPADFRDMKVPDILLSGDHAKVAKWRTQQALERTKKNRPDLLP
ncbi:tRNA (guanosine(37)-N1)-methyltransferase TrmD [soil metagenome]